MNTLSGIGVLLFCAVVIRLSQVRRRKLHRLPLPPGPPAEPIIGHMRLFPDVETTAETFHEWSQKYGDVFSLRVPGKTIIVLGSEQAAVDLLEKRSAIYSSRARLGYYEAIGWGDAIIFAPYGPFHTLQRKFYHDGFGKNVVSQYWEIQQREANVLLKGLLEEPESYDRYARRFAGATVTEIGYGHRIESFDDDFFYMGEKLGQTAGKGATPSLLDIHPIFARLPSWAPGAWFVNFIKDTKPFMDAIILGNYQKVEEELKAGTAKPSFTSQHLESMEGEAHDPQQYRALRMAAGMIFAAGFETTWHTLTIFIAAILLHPEVQKKAQEELDRVIGRGRLPELSDRDSLPYMQCVMHETMRWHPITPIGLPHQVMADDTYRGMHIPKDAIIIANARGLTWDENKFHDARSFKPERFLPKPEGAGEIFPTNAVYGWGRRICAGRFLADNSVWIAMARIIAVFDITPPKDAEGRLTKPNIKFTTQMTRSVGPSTL
ncbi:cytochrome P450 [Irpex rosettiformis]|uniref:Cytochrome P450 n=1 Tax=Irpex rosettiformis TaxID=378272 RepID=A0ACB8UFG2_9APHY|nr:cytochrome P450 [Irpex rosettiformis]